ncbi:MAG TPA: hypothetical protein VIL29_04510 [Pseudothermotoga sp.]|uniref:hypothetical protein n=1 Tax=Thermotoga profunda TaxID=1508420 RepID=UPI0005979372|nr:hypothetical protein [Thermotoga profunda]
MKCLIVIVISLSMALIGFGNILYTDDFCYTLDTIHAVLMWSENNLSFTISPSANFSIRIDDERVALLTRILKYSRLELTTKISKDEIGFYIQDRKPFLAFNHFTIGFDMAQYKSIVFSTIVESYGILPDQYVNLGASLRIYENGERLLKLLAHIRLWQFGMIASMNYGGDTLCGVSFYFSF